MTNREYIQKTLSRFNVDDDQIELILVDNDLDGDSNVVVSSCKAALYASMSSILPATIANVSEGGYSLSWNVEGLKLWYNALCREIGKDNVLVPKPKVRNRSNCW